MGTAVPSSILQHKTLMMISLRYIYIYIYIYAHISLSIYIYIHIIYLSISLSIYIYIYTYIYIYIYIIHIINDSLDRPARRWARRRSPPCAAARRRKPARSPPSPGRTAASPHMEQGHTQKPRSRSCVSGGCRRCGRGGGSAPAAAT